MTFGRGGKKPAAIRENGPELSCMKSCIFPKKCAKSPQKRHFPFHSYPRHFLLFPCGMALYIVQNSGTNWPALTCFFSGKSFSAQDSKSFCLEIGTWVRIPPSPPPDWVWTHVAFQALFLCPNDRVSQKIPNADAFGIFSFHFSLFVLYLHSPCVQPLHQNDCENPTVHIQAAAMAAEKVSPVEKRRPSLLEYSLS